MHWNEWVFLTCESGAVNAAYHYMLMISCQKRMAEILDNKMLTERRLGLERYHIN